MNKTNTFEAKAIALKVTLRAGLLVMSSGIESAANCV